MRLLRLILTLFTDSRQMVFDHTGRDSQGLYYENRWFCITDDKGDNPLCVEKLPKWKNRWNSNGFSGCIGIAKGSRTPLRRELQFVTVKNEMILN